MDTRKLDRTIDKCITNYTSSRPFLSASNKGCDKFCCLGGRFDDASIASPDLVEQNPHCRQAILNGGNRSMLYPFFSRVLAADHPQADYSPTPPGYQTTVLHWGQRKLLLSEIEFLTLIGRDNLQGSVVVYAGAAPGSHTLFLSKLFPQVFRWVLVDPAPFSEDLMGIPEIIILQEYFTNELANEIRLKARSRPIYFISDIRTVDSQELDRIKVEEGVLRDMMAQSQWHNLLKSRRCMLKFRLPWNIGRGSIGPQLTYLDGDIYLPVWGRHTTSECRLITRDWNGEGSAPTKVYNNYVYEKQMYYFNRNLRPSLYHHPYVGQGIDHCYDCTAEMLILQLYKDNFFPALDVPALSARISLNIPPGTRTLASPNLDQEQQQARIRRRQQHDRGPAPEVRVAPDLNDHEHSVRVVPEHWDDEIDE